MMHVPLDHLFQQDEYLLPGVPGWDRDQTWKHRWHLYGGKFGGFLLTCFFTLFSAILVFLLLRFPAFLNQQRCDVQRLIADQREGPGCIHRHGGEYRIDGFVKITVHIGGLFL